MSLIPPKATILVIDDDAVTRQIAQTALGKAGYRVTAIANGTDGLQWLAHHFADIVITDIFMPDVDGLEVVIAVRQSCPGARILVISGGSALIQKDYLPVAERLGADATLTKPFRPAALLAAVESLAESREREGAVFREMEG